MVVEEVMMTDIDVLTLVVGINGNLRASNYNKACNRDTCSMRVSWRVKHHDALRLYEPE